MNRTWSINEYGEPYTGDTGFVAKCRLLQSIYRVEIGEQIRPYKGRDRVYYFGNYIDHGESSGANFLEEYIFAYAKYRLAYKRPYETINSDRLYNNLLSSQPMAFNLFCPLKRMLNERPSAATLALRAALPDHRIAEVTDVELEYIPANYMELSGDKSAMDAIIRFVDEDGNKSFIAIETKYSENLGTNVAYDTDENGNKTPRQQSIKAVKRLKCFSPDVERDIINGDIALTQIYRNFLLSEMYGLEERLRSYSIILAPREHHPSTERELDSLTNRLCDEYKGKIEQIYLEDFVERLIANTPLEYSATFCKFYDRYLNFDKVNTK